MIAWILIAITAVLFILLAIAYNLKSFFRGDVEKKLARVRNSLRFRRILNIYLKNYFRVGRDNFGLFPLYEKISDPRIGEYWTKYQSLDVEDFNRAEIYLDSLRQEKRNSILEKRRKNLALPKPKEVNEDFIIY